MEARTCARSSVRTRPLLLHVVCVCCAAGAPYAVLSNLFVRMIRITVLSNLSNDHTDTTVLSQSATATRLAVVGPA